MKTTKILALLALLLGLTATGVSIYGMSVPYPEFRAIEAHMEVPRARAAEAYRLGHDAAARVDAAEAQKWYPALWSAHEALDRGYITSWVTGGLALLLGVIAARKRRDAGHRLPAITGAVLGLVGASMTIFYGVNW